MKNSKLFFCFFLFLSFLFSNAISQINGEAEFMLVNRTADIGNAKDIKVDIYPIYSIYNGNKEYAFNAKNPILPPTNEKIWGIHNNIISYQNPNYIKANFDYTSDIQNCDFSLGYGLYGIIFYEYINNQWVWKYSCSIDFSDANFTGFSVEGYFQKIRMDYYNNENIFVNFIDLNGNNTTPFNIWEGQYGNSVKVWEQIGTGNPEHTPSKEGFTDFSENSQYHSYPLDAFQYGFFRHDYPEQFKLNLNVSHHNAELISGKTLHFYSCFEISDGYNFTANNSCQEIYIDGQGISGQAIFRSGNGSINLPENFKIKIWDGASIESIGSSFLSSSPSFSWFGIWLSNPGSSIISYCNFRDASYSIYSTGNLDKDLVISNNTFELNFPGILQSAISTRNTNKISILNNYFYLYDDNNLGIDIFNYSYSEEDNNSIDEYNINIVGNEFQDGNIQLNIESLTGSIPVFISGNSFSKGIENMRLTSVNGTISSNNITSSYECWNSTIFLNNSSPDFYNNNISSILHNIISINYSYPHFSPVISDDQFDWTAGCNNFTSSDYNNIYAPNDNPGYFYIYKGNNNFMRNNYGNYHIEGYLKTDETTYLCGGNCWYLLGQGTSPIYSLKQPNETPITLNNSDPPSTCTYFEYSILNRIITDRGHGIYDTILITNTNNTPPPPSDVALYGTGVNNQKLKNYGTAISNFKNLINNYPNSKHLERSIFNLYECYVSSDTNHNQGWRNVIFGDLKSFLENKIQEYDSNEAFVSLAFDFLLKCKVKIKSYQPAMDGYEFIAENSPSATERLMASLSYIDVEGLLQGSGGGQKESKDYTDELNSDVNGKPIKEILLASYNKTKEAKTKREKSELKNSNDVVRTKAEQEKRNKQDKVLEKRASENIRISGSLTKEERRERIQKDMMLLTSRGTTLDNFVKTNNSTPLKYELSQNYPNPFNPITNTKYQVPKTGMVTIKIYDIIGREIKTLVNEVKNPGSYIVTFNGSEFASGVYFYRIQSGDFVQVKKMLLIK
jgi:hypothetical protein